MDSCFSTNYITGLEVLRDQLPADPTRLQSRPCGVWKIWTFPAP